MAFDAGWSDEVWRAIYGFEPSDMAKSRDEDGREVEIDERWFMEWVDFGIADLEGRLAAEARMDEIDKRERGESDGAQQD